MVKEVLVLLVMFWNLENFFDPFSGNSGIKNLNEGVAAAEPYTPHGEKFWTWKKFERKRDDIARTVALAKEEYRIFPAIIGLAEVENRFVLNQLTQNTILAPLEYGVIHNDSPDKRGIDVALLYRKKEFRPIETAFYSLMSGCDSSSYGSSAKLNEKTAVVPTRELLYAKGLFRMLDTIHLFVVHWPSKLSGKEAVNNRNAAARLLKEKSDSIMVSNPEANIIVMGDFNDDLADNATICAGSLANINNGRKDAIMRKSAAGNIAMQNLASADSARKDWSINDDAGTRRNIKTVREPDSKEKLVSGTYKYKGKWEMIDHFLVSRQMVGDEGEKYLYCREDGCDIFAHPFLLEQDKTYLGYKVRRTLVGPRYNGGVSDHLPILLRVQGYVF